MIVVRTGVAGPGGQYNTQVSRVKMEFYKLLQEVGLQTFAQGQTQNKEPCLMRDSMCGLGGFSQKMVINT